MNQLKFALGKEDKDEKSISRVGNSIKYYNKSKSESIWALDPDVTGGPVEEDQDDRQLAKVGPSLESLLRNAFLKEKVFS
jgi:hypothetical protein